MPRRAVKKEVATVEDLPDDFDYESNKGDVDPKELLEAIKRAKEFVYDLETSSLNPRTGHIEGIAFYVPAVNEQKTELSAWYPFTENTFVIMKGSEGVSLRPAMDQEKVMGALKNIFDLEDVLAITANGKFDMGFLRLASGLPEPIEVKCRLGDSMIADYMSDERRFRYGLKNRVSEVFHIRMTTYEEASQRQGQFSFMNPKPLGAYSMRDCYWTYRLHQISLEDLRRQDPSGKLEKIYWNIEMKLMRIIMEMETTGCLIDYEHLAQLEKKLESQKLDLVKKIVKQAGWAPNLRSPAQVSDFLFNSPEDGGLGLPTDGIEQGEGGVYSTAEKVIKHFGRKNELVKALLDYRSLEVLDRSFCKKLIKLSQEEGRVYTGFSQVGTVTGRLSCVAGDTLLVTSQGPIKIADLMLNDSRDYLIETHKGRQRAIVDKIFKGFDHLFKVTLENGSSITCTKNHRFLAPHSGPLGNPPRWPKLLELNIGDSLVVSGRNVSSITSIIPVGIGEVWDITVDEDESYVAHGFISHNSSKPINLQNIPTEKGMIRKAFVAKYPWYEESDLELIDGDASQAELRICAHLSQDPSLLEVYNSKGICTCERFLYFYECANTDKNVDCSWSGLLKEDKKVCPSCKGTKLKHQKRCRHTDIHQRTSEDVGVPRQLSKVLNFSTLYRVGAPKFAVTADLFDADGQPQVDYARELIDRWMATYWRVPEWQYETEQQLKKDNWIAITATGRRRRLDQEKAFSEYGAVTQGINFKVQALCQDLMKLGMIRVYEFRQKKIANSLPQEKKMWSRLKFLWQVHDEVGWECPKSISDEALVSIKYEMENVAKLRAFWVFDLRKGNSWEECK